MIKGYARMQALSSAVFALEMPKQYRVQELIGQSIDKGFLIQRQLVPETILWYRCLFSTTLMHLSENPSETPSQKSQGTRGPSLLRQLAQTSTLVLSLVGCTANTPEKNEQPPAILYSKETPVQEQEPISDYERLMEMKSFSDIRAYAYEIVQDRKALQELNERKGMIGEDQEKLRNEQTRYQVHMEYTAVKAYRSVMETDPRCWPRLLEALKAMTQKEAQQVRLEHFGEREKRSDTPRVLDFQRVMYKELMELMASLIAGCDRDLYHISLQLQNGLDGEEKGRLRQQMRDIEKIRSEFIKSIENGNLFPKEPVPEYTSEQELLNRFYEVREARGGLPKGQASGPKEIKFGPVYKGQEGASEKAPQEDAHPEQNPHRKQSVSGELKAS